MRYNQYILILLLFIVSGLTAGCIDDIQSSIYETEQSIGQIKEDIRFISWISNSSEILITDYVNMKNATELNNTPLLKEYGTQLKEDSSELLMELDEFELSPALQNFSSEYRNLLEQSNEIGVLVEQLPLDTDLSSVQIDYEMAVEFDDFIQNLSISSDLINMSNKED